MLVNQPIGLTACQFAGLAGQILNFRVGQIFISMFRNAQSAQERRPLSNGLYKQDEHVQREPIATETTP